TVAADGSVGESEVYRAAVVNRAKLAYDSVAAWLDGREAAPPAVATVPGMDAQLRVQDRIAQALKTHRHPHGALSLEGREGRDGRPFAAASRRARFGSVPRAASRGRSGALSRPVARGREAPRQGRVRSATAG